MSDFTASPATEQKLKQAFKILNRFMVLMWRLGLGTFMRWRWLSGKIMVISHVGRKTGVSHRTPVNYSMYNGDIYCTAGFGQISDWYRNVIKHPQVEIWLPGSWWMGTAEDVTDMEDAPARLKDIIVASGFAAYLFGVNPERLLQEDLYQMLKTYRVVRIRRTAACTGSGGPGDLSWIWPLATFLLIIWKKKQARR